MALYKIADFIIDIQNRFGYIEKQCAEYKYDGDGAADLTVKVTDAELEAERKIAGDGYSPGYLESICAYRQIAMKLPENDALLMHGATFELDGRGIIFIARSGVGKSTHTFAWKRLYGDKMTVVNGDKPIIRFFDGVPYAYGTPWAGKERLQNNTRARLTDICILERGVVNSTVKVEPAEYLDQIMQQVLHPADPMAALKTLELVDGLAQKCNFWNIKCNISDEAAIVSHDAIFGG